MQKMNNNEESTSSHSSLFYDSESDQECRDDLDIVNVEQEGLTRVFLANNAFINHTIIQQSEQVLPGG